MSKKKKSKLIGIAMTICIILMVFIGIAGGIYLAFQLKQNDTVLGTNLIKYGSFGLKQFAFYIIVALIFSFITRRVGGGIALPLSVLGYFASFFITFFILLYKSNQSVIGSIFMILIWGTATILIPAIISFILSAIAFDWDLSTRDEDEVHEETDIFGKKVYKTKLGKVVATSEKDIFGNDVIKDAKGQKIAETREDIFGRKNYVDNNLNVVAHEEQSMLSNKKIIDNKTSKEIYEVEENLLNTKIKKK